MDEKPRIPSWLQDRKKVLILAIVIICMIASAFNTAMIGATVARSVLSNAGLDLNSAASISNFVQMIGSAGKLDGTYQNNYVDEALEFGKDGSLIYSYAGNVIFGEYEFEGDYLVFELDGYEYYFEVLDNDGEVLNLLYNGYEYDYTKLY